MTAIGSERFTVRSVQPSDAGAWLELRTALWPGSKVKHADDIKRFFDGRAREPLAAVIAITTSGSAIGLVELSIRAYAEGCETDRVAFVEGWYVRPEARGQGVGRALIRSAEQWATRQGCTELGSAAEADNAGSAAAHRAVGFTDAGLVRCFRKDLELSAPNGLHQAD